MQDNVTQAVDWDAPLETNEDNPRSLVKDDFHPTMGYWVYREGTTEPDNDGMWVMPDGGPHFKGDAFCPLGVRNRLASTTAQTEAVQKLVEALEGFVGDLTNGGRNPYTSLTISHDGLNARIKQARKALAAHRESQP